MDASTFADELREENETALSRLGSSKGLYALTGGEMDAPTVRAVAHDEAETATLLFSDWADNESNDDAADLFATAAEDAERHRDSIESDEGDVDAERPEYDVLSGFETTQERVGGFLAQTFVARKSAEQMVGFFIGSAKTSSADTFRGLRDDLESQSEQAVTVLGEVCASDEDWDAAREAATAVIEAAYQNYVETLESMGVKPKNVC